MQTKLYSDLMGMIMSLTGQSFSLSESVLIKNLVNRRAQRAYRASNYWNRFLVIGEERAVSSNVIGFTESGKDPIDTFLRIHKQKPYQTASVQEFDFMVTNLGATIIAGTLSPTSAWVTYKSQLSSTYGDNANEELNVPNEWYQYMAFGVYADYLKREGLQEKAMLAEQEAEIILQDELMKLDEQHTQTLVSQRIMTNSNMQLRY
jgi:hypothetical protein